MTKEEFQQKVIPIGDKMYRIAFRLLGNQESAKDLLQELFLKLWERRSELNDIRNIEAFACTIIKNKCLDRIRTQKLTVDIDDIRSYGIDPDAAFERSESLAEIRKVMLRLPERQRLMMQMRDIDGCSFEEISQVTDTSENNVRVQLCLARKWVREELKKVYNYGIPGN